MLRTDRDNEILDALTCRVRLFSLEQLAAAWWAGATAPAVHARRRLSALVKSGWLYSTHVHAGPMLSLTEPLEAWLPGNPTPDLGGLARRLAERWTSSEPPNGSPFSRPRSKRTQNSVGRGDPSGSIRGLPPTT